MTDPLGDGQQLTDEQLRRIIVSVWKGDPAIESVQWWDNLMRLARAIEAVRRTPPMMPSLRCRRCGDTADVSFSYARAALSKENSNN